MSLRNRFGVFCFALTFVTAYTYAFAKPPTTDSPCATPHEQSPVLESFSIVHLTDVSAIKSTIVPVLPVAVFAAIIGGAKVNNRITYDRKGIVGDKGIQFKNELFLVVGGVEAPEPFAFITVRVHEDDVDTLCRSDTATTTPTVVPERDLDVHFVNPMPVFLGRDNR